jgi:P-type conjugative transfer protein TrbJ
MIKTNRSRVWWRSIAVITVLCVQASFGYAQNVVFDPTNHAEAVKHTLQLQEQYRNALDQYKTLLNQLEVMERNAKPLSQHINTNVQNNVESMLAKSKVSGGKGAFPSPKSANYYKRTCMAIGRECTEAEIAELDEHRGEMLNHELYAQNANLRALEEARTQASADAQLLQTIEANAATANGLLEAIQYNNQLAAMNAAQLMQLRLLLAAQGRVKTAQEQRLTDEASQQEGTSRGMRPKDGQSAR